MSSHREAPDISKDPVADSTDFYAFVSPERPDTITLICNYIPEGPAGGPNFYEFGNDVLYEIHVDNDGDALADVTFQFRFDTEVTNPDTFLYNTGPITALDSPSWNRRQKYTVTKVLENGPTTVLGSGLMCPPCNIGPRSTPNYEALAAAAIHPLVGGLRVFAGQRYDPFYVDLGSIFDLGTLRPFENLHLIPSAAAAGVDTNKTKSVHSIALQVPKDHLIRHGAMPTSQADPAAVIGCWCTASRQRMRMQEAAQSGAMMMGPWVQVSRLGNPLFNEVIVPMSKKDYWNAISPKEDGQFLARVQHPELAALLPILYPKVFPNLAAYKAPRADLAAILLTGIPSGIVPGFQNYTGAIPSDMLRLNTMIPPAQSPNLLGVVGGDLAGFPNGRRVMDDITTIELRAVAGATIPLVDKTYKVDKAATIITDGLTAQPPNRYLATFPYVGVPLSGYSTPSK